MNKYLSPYNEEDIELRTFLVKKYRVSQVELMRYDVVILDGYCLKDRQGFVANGSKIGVSRIEENNMLVGINNIVLTAGTMFYDV